MRGVLPSASAMRGVLPSASAMRGVLLTIGLVDALPPPLPRSSRALDHQLKLRRNAREKPEPAPKNGKSHSTCNFCTDRESNPGLYRGRVLFYH